MCADTIKATVQRGSGTSEHEVYAETFDVPNYKNQTVLDVVTWIQQNADATLSYRFACRVGMCGSCAMMVNGVPRWTCRTHLSRVLVGNELSIAPLRNLPLIKDLVVDMDPFFSKWVAAEGVHHARLTREDPIVPIDEKSHARVEANKGIECINCSVCYAACDTVTANAEYLGPAALLRAWTLLHDARDDGRKAILDAVSVNGGCHNCHSIGSCSVHCPNELDPMSAIAGLKRESVLRFFSKAES